MSELKTEIKFKPVDFNSRPLLKDDYSELLSQVTSRDFVDKMHPDTIKEMIREDLKDNYGLCVTNDQLEILAVEDIACPNCNCPMAVSGKL
jgi:hypothetical protein